MTHRFTISVVTLLAVASLVVPAAAQNKCDAGKLKCIRQKVGCLIKVHEKSQKKGAPPDAAKLQRCMEKFYALHKAPTPPSGCFAKVEAKFGVECSTALNGEAVEAQVDQDVQDYLDALSIVIPTTTSTISVPTTSSTTTTTIPPLACGDTGDIECGGACPSDGTCYFDGFTEDCMCTASECDQVGAVCIGSCATSGGACACPNGICLQEGIFCAIQGQACGNGGVCAIIPGALTFGCLGGGCSTDADCAAVGGGACLCLGGGCTCQ